MISDNRIFQSLGTNIPYRIDRADSDHTANMVRFDYVARYIPTGEEFPRFVYLFHISDSAGLLQSWNYAPYHKEWDYRTA